MDTYYSPIRISNQTMNIEVTHFLSLQVGDSWQFKFRNIQEIGIHNISSLELTKSVEEISWGEGEFTIKDPQQRSCSRPYGWFEVLELKSSKGQVNALAVDFAISCQGRYTMFSGSIRYLSKLRFHSDIEFCRQDLECERQLQDHSTMYLHELQKRDDDADNEAITKFKSGGFFMGIGKKGDNPNDLKRVLTSGNWSWLALFNQFYATQLSPRAAPAASTSSSSQGAAPFHSPSAASPLAVPTSEGAAQPSSSPVPDTGGRWRVLFSTAASRSPPPPASLQFYYHLFLPCITLE